MRVHEMSKTVLLVAAALATLACSRVNGATLFSDDLSSGAAWTVNAQSPTEDTATFGYDYLTGAGIPAPPGGSDTVGLRIDANAGTAVSSSGGVTVTPTGQSFSGKYTLSFDVWSNIPGPAPAGGTGSTEYSGGGIGYDGTTINGPLGAGSGGYYFQVGDGSSSRDYRMYKDAGEQFIASGQYNPAMASNNGADPFFASISPVVDISTFDPPQTGQTGLTEAGDPMFNWTHVIVSVNESSGKANIFIDGKRLGTLDANVGSSFPLTGGISLFHYDRYSSQSGPLGFAIFDNVKVTDNFIPEAASITLLALGGVILSLCRRRLF